MRSALGVIVHHVPSRTFGSYRVDVIRQLREYRNRAAHRSNGGIGGFLLRNRSHIEIDRIVATHIARITDPDRAQTKS